MKNPATSLQAVQPGGVIGGCEIIRLIGRGGMGSVYEAHQISLDRRVAVKVFKPTENIDEQTLRDRLFKEARLVAKLNHPNIVQVFDVGEDRGVPFMVMEYVEGVTLHDLLNLDSAFPIDRMVRIAINVSRGLAAAHERRIVHQDIKPENILLSSGGGVKITDFGAAGLFRNKINPEEAIFGTPLYMAPEILLGKSFDGRVDVYALGLVLYRALAGRHPFMRKTCQQVLEAQVHEALPPLGSLRPEVPPGLVRLIERVCAKEPHERLTSEEMLRAFESNPEWEAKPAAPQRGGDLLRERPGAASEPLAAPAPSSAGALDLVGLRDSLRPDPVPGAPAPPAAGGQNAPAAPSSGSGLLRDSGLRRERKVIPTEAGLGPGPAPPERPPIEAAATPRPRRRQRPAPGSAPPAGPAAAPQAATPPGGAPPPKAAAGSGADQRLQQLCIKARFQMMRKNWKGAEDIFRSALALDPRNPVALLGLARLHVEQGRPDEAIELLRRALDAGQVSTRAVLESRFFAALKDNKAFRALMAKHLV